MQRGRGRLATSDCPAGGGRPQYKTTICADQIQHGDAITLQIKLRHPQ